MARSERAKELAAKQKAEAKALKEAKRNSNDPRDWGTFRQIKESFKLTHEYDKQLPWLIGGAWIGTIVVCVAISFIANGGAGYSWIWAALIGLMLGATFALLILTNRTKRATYQRYKGQPGAGEVPLTMLNKKKWSYQAAIAFNRQMDTIHRAVGPAGVVLIGDGNAARLEPLLTSEGRRHEQVLFGVPVHVIQIGDEPGQIKLEDVAKHIESLPKKLDKLQLDEAKSRLVALDAMKSRVPLPKGPLPTNAKVGRRAMRGR